MRLRHIAREFERALEARIAERTRIARDLHDTLLGSFNALRNAFQHSHGTRIEVELRYHRRQFSLRIRDDGQGVDAHILASQGRAGHFGLKGMHERADLAGGKLGVWSARGIGTELELSIPGPRAYSGSRS